MIKLISALDIITLLIKANALEYWRDGSGAEMSITQSGGLPNAIVEPFRVAIEEIVKWRNKTPLHLMINNLPSGVTTPIHIDTVKSDNEGGRKRLERWHLPLLTNNECYWWDEETGNLKMLIGYWYGPMPYWINHKVWNLGSTNRIHLIVDLLSD